MAIIKKKYSKKNIPKKIKILVWNKYIGEKKGVAKCWCCRDKKISQMDFHCGHVIPEINKGNLTVENLRPICASCNLSMGSKNMLEFINLHGLHKRMCCIQ